MGLPKGLAKLLAAGANLLGEDPPLQEDGSDEGSDEENYEEEEPEEPPDKNKKGGKSAKAKAKASTDPLDIDVETLIAQMAKAGKLDLKDLLMIKLLAGKDKSAKNKSTKADASSGESSSEDDDTVEKVTLSGLKGFGDVRYLTVKRDRKPMKHVLEWEAEVKQDLGVDEGVGWSVREWRRRRYWGAFKSMNRCAEMDVEVYMRARELVKNKGPISRKAVWQILAQLVQNLKAKSQLVVDQGDWGQAWELTGLADLCGRRDFMGSPEEMLRISRHLTAKADLKDKRDTLKTVKVEAPTVDPGDAALPLGWKAKAKAKGKGGKGGAAEGGEED